MRRETGTRTWSFRRVIIALSMGAVPALLTLAPAMAQKKSGPVRQVRVIEAAKRGFPSPAGVAYSPRADALMVFGAAPQQGSELRLITMSEDTRGSVRLATAITDPRNAAFDAKAGRLLILEARRRELIAIPARPDGNLDPARQVRFATDHFGLVNPRGLAVDSVSGRLFVLDKGGLLRIEPDEQGGFDTAAVSRVDLGHLALTDPRGLAFDPTTNHLHVLSGAKWMLYELTEEAELVATRDLSRLGLFDPRGMVFAPSGDTTDDPGNVSVYIADAGRRRPQPSASTRGEGAARPTGGIVELSLLAPPTPAVVSFTSRLVATKLTSDSSPARPAASGITYLPASGTLWQCNGKADERTTFAGAEAWETTLGGSMLSTHNVQSFSDEPTGVTVNPANQHLFYTDGNKRRVFEVDPGADGLYHTRDDVVTSFSTLAFGSADPEDVVYDASDGVMFLGDGLNAEIYRISPGANGVFDGVRPSGDDVVTQFDTSVLGITDPEGLTLNDKGNLYIVGKPRTVVAEITKSGTLVQTIDISAANARKPSGLAYRARQPEREREEPLHRRPRGRQRRQDVRDDASGIAHQPGAGGRGARLDDHGHPERHDPRFSRRELVLVRLHHGQQQSALRRLCQHLQQRPVACGDQRFGGWPDVHGDRHARRVAVLPKSWRAPHTSLARARPLRRRNGPDRDQPRRVVHEHGRGAFGVRRHGHVRHQRLRSDRPERNQLGHQRHRLDGDALGLRERRQQAGGLLQSSVKPRRRRRSLAIRSWPTGATARRPQGPNANGTPRPPTTRLRLRGPPRLPSGASRSRSGRVALARGTRLPW